MENSKEQGKKKITEEDLGKANGGWEKDKTEVYTSMQCSSCNFVELWNGDFKDGNDYQCPHCGSMSFRGVSKIKLC